MRLLRSFVRFELRSQAILDYLNYIFWIKALTSVTRLSLRRKHLYNYKFRAQKGTRLRYFSAPSTASTSTTTNPFPFCQPRQALLRSGMESRQGHSRRLYRSSSLSRAWQERAIFQPSLTDCQQSLSLTRICNNRYRPSPRRSRRRRR